ncbi:MAG: tetratricopeptide (TPR) repeat protein [Planctomycetota bacterium]|jgi:tetratricopeptide (TPR) repeat protein
MDLQPVRRYASAAHFAIDLTQLLAGEPIEARPLSIYGSCLRYTRQRPAHTAVLGLAILILIGGSIGYEFQEARPMERVLTERDLAAAHRDAALDAIDAIEHWLEKVGHRDLREVSGVKDLRRELLGRATTLYQRLEDSPEPNLRLRVRTASALGKLARLRHETGDLEGAQRGFDEAETRLAALAAKLPNDAEVLYELGNLRTFASASRHASDADAGIAAGQESLAMLRPAVELDPYARRQRADLARGLCLLGYFHDLKIDRKPSRALM